MWAGVQNVSRPMERCQEMSHWPPIMAEVTPKTAHQTYQGTRSTDSEAMEMGDEIVVEIVAMLSLCTFTIISFSGRFGLVSAGDGRGQLGLGFGPGCVSGAACRGFFHSGWAIFRHRAGRGWELRRRVLRVPRNPRIFFGSMCGLPAFWSSFEQNLFYVKPCSVCRSFRQREYSRWMRLS